MLVVPSARHVTYKKTQRLLNALSNGSGTPGMHTYMSVDLRKYIIECIYTDKYMKKYILSTYMYKHMCIHIYVFMCA